MNKYVGSSNVGIVFFGIAPNLLNIDEIIRWFVLEDQSMCFIIFIINWCKVVISHTWKDCVLIASNVNIDTLNPTSKIKSIR